LPDRRSLPFGASRLRACGRLQQKRTVSPFFGVRCVMASQADDVFSRLMAKQAEVRGASAVLRAASCPTSDI
jgi:hypothetical protein